MTAQEREQQFNKFFGALALNNTRIARQAFQKLNPEPYQPTGEWAEAVWEVFGLPWTPMVIEDEPVEVVPPQPVDLSGLVFRFLQVVIVLSTLIPALLL